MTIVNIIRIIMPQEKNNINEIPAYSAFLFKLDIQKQLEEEENEILEEKTKENAHSDSFEKDSSIRNKKHQLKVLNHYCPIK